MIYTVNAKQWAHGWELHIDGVGVTQSHTLTDAADMVRDYLAGDGIDTNEVEVLIVPNLDDLGDDVREARNATKDAMEAQRRAAMASRRVARRLRKKGLSVRDTAFALGISPGRVSQLTRVSPSEAGEKV